MDDYNFHPSEFTPVDTTFDIEGYDEYVDEVEKNYPGDYRTQQQKIADEELEAQQKEQLELGDQIFDPEQEVDPDQLTFPEEGEEESITGSDPDPYNIEGGSKMFEPKAQAQVENQFTENERNLYRTDTVYSDEEYELNDTFQKKGGDRNLEATVEYVEKVNASPALLAVYDVNNDGRYTVSDRFGGGEDFTYEQETEFHEKWMDGLRNKKFSHRTMGMFMQYASEGFLGGWMPGRQKQMFNLEMNQSRMLNERRRHMFNYAQTKRDRFENMQEGMTSNPVGGLYAITDQTLQTLEKAAAHITPGGTGWSTHDPIMDDILLNKGSLYSQMLQDPVQRSMGDGFLYELGYWMPSMVATWGATSLAGAGMASLATTSKFAIPAFARTGLMGMSRFINPDITYKAYYTGKAGQLFGPKGAQALARTGFGHKNKLVNFLVGTGNVGRTAFKGALIETMPTAMFRDYTYEGLNGIENQGFWIRDLASKFYEVPFIGPQLAHGLESPLGIQFTNALDETVTDGLFGMGMWGAFKGIGRVAGGRWRLNQTNYNQLKTSTYEFDSAWKGQGVRDDDYWFDIRNQKNKDIEEAGAEQLTQFDDGPNNAFVDDGLTPAQYNSGQGAYKAVDHARQPGQGGAARRQNTREVLNGSDEIYGQVGVDGGSTGQLFGPLELRKAAKQGFSDAQRVDLADALVNDPVYKQQVESLPNKKRIVANMHEGTLKRIQEIDGRDAASLSPREYWGDLINDTKLSTGAIGDLDPITSWSIQNLQVADAINQSLLFKLRDMANSTDLIAGKTDLFAVDGSMRRIADNLVLGLSEVKRTRYTWNLMREMLGAKGGKLSEDMLGEITQNVGRRGDELLRESQDGVRLMMKMLENNDSNELVEGILEVFKMSNKIHNFKDFDAWMRQKIRGGKFDGKVKTGAMVSELQAVMVNSILSGPKTPLRAILGTTTNAYYNSLNEAAGALVRSPFSDNIVQRRIANAKLKAMFDLIPEAYQIFRSNLKSKFGADFANIRTRYSEGVSRGDHNWELYKAWTERNGTDGDKAALYITNQARDMNNNKLFSWSPRVMAATDDTFKWLMARARSREKGLRDIIDTLDNNTAEVDAGMLKQAEDAHMAHMLDADGNIDLSKDMWLQKQFQEITLTSELKGFAAKLDDLMNTYPLFKPFYLFARTGINGLNLSYKNSPLLGVLHKESIDILKHRGNDFTELFQYGIENAQDLSNARNLLAGRQAVGSAVVTSMVGMYMADQLTGNGPADRQLKQQWINSGWKPNHLYFGSVGFDYSSLEPFNVIFSAIADIGDNMELMGSDWAEKRLQAVAFVIGRGLTGKTYMSGLDQLMQMAQMKPWAWNKTVANIFNNSLPLAGMRNEFGKWINPHMKELNSDMWSSLRNRNQLFEYATNKPLLEKSDMLNGKPINNWNFMGRAFNAVSPIQIDYRSKSPGRKLLLDSNYDLKSTTYAYGGYSFVKNANVRAYFQNEIGNAPITFRGRKFQNLEKALDYVSTLKDVQISMAKMESNRNNPSQWDIDPNTYPHNTIIDRLVEQARSKAWAIINQTTHPGYTELLEVKTAKDGKNSRTRTNRSEILDLSFPKKTSPNFPRAN